MNKETLIAAGVGLTLGLAVTIGVYGMKKTIAPEKTNQLSVSPTPAASTTQETGTLKITSPDDGYIATDKSLTVKGSTTANQIIVVLVGNEENIIKSNADGAYSAEVTLKTGPNIITVVAVDENGQTNQLSKLVVYELAPTGKPESATPSATPTVTVKPTTTPKLSPTSKVSPTIKPTATPTSKP